MNNDIMMPIIISLKVSIISTIITSILSIFIAWMMVKFNKKNGSVLEAIITLPLVLPPSILGYILLIVIGNNGLIGKIFYDNFGLSVIFTWKACVIASVIVSFPLMYQNCKASFQSIDKKILNAARTMGASEWKIFFRIAIPLAYTGIISGLILAFARSLGEFGATMMVAGNIPNKTQTIPLAMYYAVERGDKTMANTLMIVVVIFSFSLIYFLNRWIEKRRNRNAEV
ncbi:MAG: molybdate ABC transporter permease subunit [Finegoldia magna]|uniref:molybdate ABC transporter permease subunit n=1 Tax=Finegoldia magna TaxID=1260 RepID=UPI00288C0134|nr:molybdate ABC transporter permease subunit [Finegoldia magna]MDU5368281.1 molybdate ABC transporter permease subunit [Finegoldia magna]MDU5444770.1 molybdate ABC transporter permease subunit [Finegoldia magna]